MYRHEAKSNPKGSAACHSKYDETEFMLDKMCNHTFMVNGLYHKILSYRIRNGSEQFYLNGSQMAAGEHIQNTADTVGDMISWVCTETACFFKSDNTNWVEATP